MKFLYSSHYSKSSTYLCYFEHDIKIAHESRIKNRTQIRIKNSKNSSLDSRKILQNVSNDAKITNNDLFES